MIEKLVDWLDDEAASRQKVDQGLTDARALMDNFITASYAMGLVVPVGTEIAYLHDGILLPE
ncbi:MAG: hypothetical protein ACTS73_08530 [Arsenophonus sp. NEOnobi-MAG3]